MALPFRVIVRNGVWVRVRNDVMGLIPTGKVYIHRPSKPYLEPTHVASQMVNVEPVVVRR